MSHTTSTIRTALPAVRVMRGGEPSSKASSKARSKASSKLSSELSSTASCSNGGQADMPDDRERDIEAFAAANPEYRGEPCRADCDGECTWARCPQHRDGEPAATRRHCPLPHWTEDPEY
jgi:hypothetical protein